MSTIMEGNQKKKAAVEPKAVSWQEKKSLADKEEEVLRKQVEDLGIWVQTMESLTDEQKKEYVDNRPNEQRTVKVQKSKLKKRVQRVEKSKPSTSSGILASVWKFHKEDEEEPNSHLQP